MTWHEPYIHSGTTAGTPAHKPFLSFNGRDYCKGEFVRRPVNQFTPKPIHLGGWNVFKAQLHPKMGEDRETDLWIWENGKRILVTKKLEAAKFYSLIKSESEETAESRLEYLAYECKYGGIGFVQKYWQKYRAAFLACGFLFCCFVFSGGKK